MKAAQRGTRDETLVDAYYKLWSRDRERVGAVQGWSEKRYDRAVR